MSVEGIIGATEAEGVYASYGEKRRDDVEIKTERLTLRPAAPEYLESTYAYASDPENTKYMMFLPVADREEALRFLEDARAEWGKETPSYYEYLILLGDRHVGGITLYRLNAPDACELGWIIHRDYWRQGIAREAAAALLDHARRMGFRRVIAQCDSENAPSYHLMEKLGMRYVGVAGGRKNRSSDEERQELTYEIVFGEERAEER